MRALCEALVGADARLGVVRVPLLEEHAVDAPQQHRVPVAVEGRRGRVGLLRAALRRCATAAVTNLLPLNIGTGRLK